MDAEGVADNLFSRPIKNDGEVEPAPGGHFDFSHVDAPELVGTLSSGFRSGGMPLGFKFIVLGDKVAGFFHESVDAFLVHRKTLAIFEIAPDAPVALKRMIGFELLDVLEQFLITLSDGFGFAASHSS